MQKNPQTFQYIWNLKIPLKNCYKISEETISISEMRRSTGLEINRISGEKSYFVPIPVK